MKTLRLILGDQLNSQHSWFQEKDDDVIYFMAEMRQETDYVAHHIQKVTAFFCQCAILLMNSKMTVIRWFIIN